MYTRELHLLALSGGKITKQWEHSGREMVRPLSVLYPSMFVHVRQSGAFATTWL